MSVRVAKINAPPAVVRIQLSILEAARPASVWKVFVFDALQNCIEFTVAHMKSVVQYFKRLRIVEVESQLVVHSHGSKVPHWTGILESEDLRKKTRRGFLVMRGHNCVIELNSHNSLRELAKSLHIRFPLAALRKKY